MEISEIEDAIRNWDNIRKVATTTVTYLNDGACFKITQEQYTEWLTKAPQPEYIHVYLGIFDNSIQFILIDSETDKSGNFDPNYIFIQPYIESLQIEELHAISQLGLDNLESVEALRRSNLWTLFMGSWINHKSESNDGLFQVFNIPFSDLQTLFETYQTQECVVVVGLRETFAGSNTHEAEMILWDNQFGVSPGHAEDLALPVPPFGDNHPKENYKLLTSSLNSST